MSEFEDRLIETLLSEELGEERCPDLTDRILQRIDGGSNRGGRVRCWPPCSGN